MRRHEVRDNREDRKARAVAARVEAEEEAVVEVGKEAVGKEAVVARVEAVAAAASYRDQPWIRELIW